MLTLRFYLSIDTDFSTVVSNTLGPLKEYMFSKDHLCNRMTVKL